MGRDLFDLTLGYSGLATAVAERIESADAGNVCTRRGVIGQLLCLTVLLSGAIALPLALVARMPLAKAAIVVLVVLTAVLVPLLLARLFPLFASADPEVAPPLAFPVVSGVIAAVIGVAVAAATIAGGDLTEGWALYAREGYPWSSLHALIAGLVAWRMRDGGRPVARWRILCCLTRGRFVDALIFAAASVVLMAVYVRPELAAVCDEGMLCRSSDLMMIPPAAAAVLGFLVPGWYRESGRFAKPEPRFRQDGWASAAAR